MPAHSDYEDDDAMDDTERLHTLDRRGSNRRKLVRFIPDVSFGTIVQSVAILIGAATAYGTYTADKEKDRARMTMIETSQASDRLQVKASIDELKGDTKEMKGDVRDLSNNMIKLQAQMQFAPAQPPRQPGNR